MDSRQPTTEKCDFFQEIKDVLEKYLGRRDVKMIGTTALGAAAGATAGAALTGPLALIVAPIGAAVGAVVGFATGILITQDWKEVVTFLKNLAVELWHFVVDVIVGLIGRMCSTLFRTWIEDPLKNDKLFNAFTDLARKLA